MITYEKFRQNLLEFLENANANLGRKTCKPRKELIMAIMKRIDDFYQPTDECSEKTQTEKVPTESDQLGWRPDSIKVIKPGDKQRGLNVGKGVHAMTATESMRADEQLNRSPFANRKEGEKEND